EERNASLSGSSATMRIASRTAPRSTSSGTGAGPARGGSAAAGSGSAGACAAARAWAYSSRSSAGSSAGVSGLAAAPSSRCHGGRHSATCASSDSGCSFIGLLLPRLRTAGVLVDLDLGVPGAAEPAHGQLAERLHLLETDQRLPVELQ